MPHAGEKSPAHRPAANSSDLEGKCVWRDASAEAKHNRRWRKDDTHGDSNEQVAECALAGRLWSVGGLSALISVLQLSLAPATVKERRSGQPDAGGETILHTKEQRTVRQDGALSSRGEWTNTGRAYLQKELKAFSQTSLFLSLP